MRLIPVLKILAEFYRLALRSLALEIAETSKASNLDYSRPRVSPSPSSVPSILALIASSA